MLLFTVFVQNNVVLQVNFTTFFLVVSSRILTGDIALKQREMAKVAGTEVPVTCDKSSQLSLDELSAGTPQALPLRLYPYQLILHLENRKIQTTIFCSLKTTLNVKALGAT